MTDMVSSPNQALSMLRADHGYIKHLLADLQTCGQVEQQKVLADLFLGLRIHSVVEQQIVYPSVCNSEDRERLADSSKDLYTMLSMMLALEASGDGEFAETLKDLAKKFEQHVSTDEHMFSHLQSESQNNLCSLADKMASCRVELEAKLAPRKVTIEDHARMKLRNKRQPRCA